MKQTDYNSYIKQYKFVSYGCRNTTALVSCQMHNANNLHYTRASVYRWMQNKWRAIELVTAKRTIRAPWKESAFPQKSYTKPR